MNKLAVLVVLLLSGCGGSFGPTYDEGGIPMDIPHFPDRSDEKISTLQVDDPEIQDTDTIEIQALKIAASQVYGNARKHYSYKEKWLPGAMEKDIKYLQYLVGDPEVAEKFQSGFWRAALDFVQSRNISVMMMRGLKIVHAKGSHECWSSKAIGYRCSVDNRMYTDCAIAIQKLRETNCCRYGHPDGVSNGFTPEGCF